MGTLKVTADPTILEPTLNGSTLILPDNGQWDCSETARVCAVVQYGKKLAEIGVYPFTLWWFYTQIKGVWKKVEWVDLSDNCKLEVVEEVMDKPSWMPFCEEDVLPDWDEEWFTLGVLGCL